MKTHQPLSLPHLPYPSLVPPPSHPHSPYPSISPFKKGENTPTFLKGTLFSSRFGEGVLKRKGAFPPHQTQPSPPPQSCKKMFCWQRAGRERPCMCV